MNTQTQKPYTEKNIREIAVERVVPNQYQPRREFDQDALAELARSIKKHGILQPLTVTKTTQTLKDGRSVFELVAGERRLRASKLAGLSRVPCVVRVGDDNKSRFELAIIENVQREDLNAVDRAKAFRRLVDEFGMTHAQIGKQMGKSRVYVSNSLRLLSLPKHIRDAVVDKKITEGHTRPLLMLEDKPAQQATLFKEIMYKKMSVRESEKIARKMAQERVRKAKHKIDPAVASIEQQFSETLGTRVHIEKGEVGGKLVIDYFTNEDLGYFLEMLQKGSDGSVGAQKLLQKFEASQKQVTSADLGFADNLTKIEPIVLVDPGALTRDKTISKSNVPTVAKPTVIKPAVASVIQVIKEKGIKNIRKDFAGYTTWTVGGGVTTAFETQKLVALVAKPLVTKKEKPGIFDFLADKNHIIKPRVSVEEAQRRLLAIKKTEATKDNQIQSAKPNDLVIPPFFNPHAGPPAIDLDAIDTSTYDNNNKQQNKQPVVSHSSSEALFSIPSADGLSSLTESPILDLNASSIDENEIETMQLVSNIAVEYGDRLSDKQETKRALDATYPQIKDAHDANGDGFVNKKDLALGNLLKNIEKQRTKEQGSGFVAREHGAEESVHIKPKTQTSHIQTMFHAADFDGSDDSVNTPVEPTLHSVLKQDGLFKKTEAAKIIVSPSPSRFTEQEVETMALKFEGTELAKLFDIKALLKNYVKSNDS